MLLISKKPGLGLLLHSYINLSERRPSLDCFHPYLFIYTLASQRIFIFVLYPPLPDQA